VRHALATLAEEGFVYTVVARGTFLGKQPEDSWL
jgi:DNA-binding GntR family transcriptional regulator